MTDMDWLTAIVGAHLGHSVALSAVLACSLLFARKMSGGGRYALCGFALLGALVLPAIALAPGASLVNRALDAVDAPIMFSATAPQEAPAAAKPGALPSATSAVASGGIGSVGDLVSGARDSAAMSSGLPFSQVADAAPATVPDAQRVEGPVASQAGDRQPSWIIGAISAAGRFFASLPDMTLFFFSAWAVGSVVLLVKTGRDLIASLRMVRGARAIELPPALARRFANVRIAVSEQAPGPIAAGVITPSILLPVGFEADLERPGMVALLEHERAHVERRDMLVALGQRLALALFWWSPALHWISRRMDEEREVACDEIAVERTGDPRAFALTLTHQAESQLWAQTPRLAAGAIGGRSQFGRRIRRLVELARGGKTAEGATKSSGRFAFTGMALVAIGAAVLTPGVPARAQDPEADLYDEAERSDAPVVRIRADQTPPQPPAPPAPLSEPPSVAPLPPAAPLPPEVVDSIDELALEAAQLGLDISALVSEDILEDLPDLLQDIFDSLEETGFTDEEFSAELAEMRQQLGPELRIHITEELNRARAERTRALQAESAEARAERQRAIAEARQEMRRARAEMERELGRAEVEIARARAEVSRALASSEARGLSAEEREEIREEVREALEEAREQIREARERGDFDIDFDFDFNDFEAPDEDIDARLEGGAEDGSRRGPNVGDFYREFDLEDLRDLYGPRAAPADFEDHAAATPASLRALGQNDCPQRG